MGERGVVLRSTDGTSWEVAARTDFSFEALIYAENRFVALGHGIHLSRDGVIWESHRLDLERTPSAIAFGQGTWLAAGSGGKFLASGGSRHPLAFEVEVKP